jgi:two-component system NtrC family sensor kinase
VSPDDAASRPRRGLIWRSLGTKLFVILLGVLLLIFGLLGYLFVSAHRRDLEEVTLISGERVSEVIRRNTSYHMMANDRAGIDGILTTLASEPGVQSVRIMDRQGRVRFSTDHSEINRQMGFAEPVCATCHAAGTAPGSSLSKQLRIFREGDERILGIITPIANTPACSNAACHAHPASHKILGILETDLSLARVDAQVAAGTRRMLAFAILGLVLLLAASGIFVWRFVHVPVKALQKATMKLAKGELGYQIEVTSDDELGDLASSFNMVSTQLHEAQREITGWTQTLEARVEQKTAELREAHGQMMQAEKMASLGKMSAVVAHEINNPLSAILTYTKLIRRWLDDPSKLPQRAADMREPLQLIESESRRCGELVKNLLSFSRASNVNMQQVQINDVLRKCELLVRHKLNMGNINLHLDLEAVPVVYADPSQLEQLFLALVMNAIEAMPQEGNLWLTTRESESAEEITVVIRDDGAGIPEELLPRMFEPFVTTKQNGQGVGLGLAISKTIVERHRGRIEVRSAPGQGTAFTITLPVHAAPGARSHQGVRDTVPAGVSA